MESIFTLMAFAIMVISKMTKSKVMVPTIGQMAARMKAGGQKVSNMELEYTLTSKRKAKSSACGTLENA